jgi:cysteine desulfurase
MEMMENAPVYLDHNATTPLLPEVIEAMLPYLREHFGNPSSGHVFGQRARQGLERAREQVAQLLGATPEELLFTSGGTEASNYAIRGVAEAAPERKHVVTSVIEHPATLAPCAWLERRGYRVTRLGVDPSGRVRPEEASAALVEDTALVTLMHANNETGVLQPIAEVARHARARGIAVHTDAAQSLGKVRVNVDSLGVDLLSVAGHKLYAPKGVGALCVRRGTRVARFTRGAGRERGRRAGSGSGAASVGVGVACEVARRELETFEARMHALREQFWTMLREQVPGLVLNGHPTERLPNTLSVRFPGVSGTALLAATPEVAASTGSACHDGHESASAVILAMGVPLQEALGTVRLTLGRATTPEELARAAQALARAWASLRA